MVSNHGKVKSLNFKGKKNGKEYILKGKINRTGYNTVELTNKKFFFVHRLVALTFIGDIKNLTVNHKDFDTLNNNVSNLELLTITENVLYSYIDKNKKGLYASNFMGVTFTKNGTWVARKTIDGKRKYLGCFKTEQEAIDSILNYKI